MYNHVPYRYAKMQTYAPTMPQNKVAQNQKKNTYKQNDGGTKVIENFSYSQQDQIGKGFSSKVYKGQADKTKEKVAIKVIDMNMLKTSFHQKLLQSEIECLRSLNHKNILKLHKVFQTQNNTYIITDFCESGDLSSKIGKLSESIVCSIIAGVIRGYKEMKQKGIIHRDLKPANILMQDQLPIIADFGFATNPQSRVGMPNVNVGSPLYMSPEALKNNQYSEKSDIWAIGVTAFELLYGKVPWSAYSEKELCVKMSTAPVNFPNGISEDAKNFIKRCLEVNCSTRATVEDLENHNWIMKNLVQEKAKFSAAKAKNTPLLQVNCKSTNDNTKQRSPLQNSVNLSYYQKEPYQIYGKENGKKTREVSMILDKSNQKSKNYFLETDQKHNRNSVSMQIDKNDENLQDYTSTGRYLTVENQFSLFNENDRKILSNLNICRFLFKLIGQLDKVKEVLSEHAEKECIMFLIGKIILERMKILEELVNSNYYQPFKQQAQDIPQNSLNLQVFEDYIVNSESFPSIQIAIKQYSQRYQLHFQTYSLTVYNQVKSELKERLGKLYTEQRIDSSMTRELIQLILSGVEKMINDETLLSLIDQLVLCCEYFSGKNVQIFIDSIVNCQVKNYKVSDADFIRMRMIQLQNI